MYKQKQIFTIDEVIEIMKKSFDAGRNGEYGFMSANGDTGKARWKDANQFVDGKYLSELWENTDDLIEAIK